MEETGLSLSYANDLNISKENPQKLYSFDLVQTFSLIIGITMYQQRPTVT